MRKKVITRIWHGITEAYHADEYLVFLEKSGVPDYKKCKGNLSVQIRRQIEDDVCHFWTVTQWDSVESIKEFAGAAYKVAKYYPEDAGYLLEKEQFVEHYQTFIY